MRLEDQKEQQKSEPFVIHCVFSSSHVSQLIFQRDLSFQVDLTHAVVVAVTLQCCTGETQSFQLESEQTINVTVQCSSKKSDAFKNEVLFFI